MLLVPPLMLAAEVYDVAPSTSAVTILHEHGVDPWVVDFGAPEREEGGLERTLDDHVLAVSDAVDRVRAATGMDVHLAGYSQGGMFCYQAAALPAQCGARVGDHVRQPGRHAAGDAARAPRATSRSAPPACSPTRVRGWALPGVGEPDRLPAARPGQDAAQSARRSCCSCTTARRCCRASASAGSSRPRAGSRGPARRWRTSCASSSRTTGCSRAGS